ncbi:uncharacterized protein TNCV_585421 [Trichonephila clavipes]|nr:uncharacterized protein TNCV_585421 [Trichonephila clavipes]
MTSSASSNASEMAYNICKQNGAPFLLTTVIKSASGIKGIILDVRFPKQKNRQVIFQCEEKALLTSERIVLFTATLHPLSFLKIIPKRLFQICECDKLGRSYHRINDTGPQHVLQSTDRVPISKTGPEGSLIQGLLRTSYASGDNSFTCAFIRPKSPSLPITALESFYFKK